MPAPEAPTTILPGARIGFVGIGNMGLPMAGRLAAAGYVVQGYDTDAGACARLTEAVGAPALTGAAETAEGAAAVILMLPSGAAVQHVLGAGGLLEAAATAGAVVIDMSSSEPTLTREAATEASQHGVALIDAPVSGGVRGAENGTLTIMAGGEAAHVDACRPIFEVLGRSVLHTGPVGSGHALKALNNLLSATTLLASSEALLVGTRFGIDPKLMLDAINGSTGRSYSTEYKLPEFVLPTTFASGFTLQLMVKDMRIAAGLAAATDTPLGLGLRSLELWEQALEGLPPGADHTEIARWVETLASQAGDG